MERPDGFLLDELQRERLLTDGAMGTELLRLGFLPPLEALNLTHPDVVRSVHAAYLDAGARVIFTNSFGANPIRLRVLAPDLDPARVNAAALAIARETAGARAFVAASLGPTGLSLDEIRKGSADRIKQNVMRQIMAMGDGADLYALETYTTLAELKPALQGAAWAKPAWAPLAALVSPRPDGSLIDASFDEWVDSLESGPNDIIGLNCGHGPEETGRLVGLLAAKTAKPVFLKLNAGVPAQGGPDWPFPPQKYFEALTKCDSPRVRLIGGCCGTGPGHIRFLAENFPFSAQRGMGK